MDVAFLTRSVSRDAGGIFEIEVALASNLRVLGCDVHVIAPADRHTQMDRHRWGGVEPEVYPFYGDSSFRFAPQLGRRFLACEADLAHLHSLWSYTSYVALKWHSATKKPFVVTPNGMLDSWALRHSSWKKRIVGALVERRMLKHAACLQANTERELQDIRKYDIRTPVAIVPNGVMLEGITEGPKIRSGRNRLLFLGRIHPKKGLRSLVDAWAEMKSRNPAFGESWQLNVAGWEELNHAAEIRQRATARGLRVSEGLLALEEDVGADIVFCGPVFGEQKNRLLNMASAFILPSHSEGLPMAVLEAWASSLPVLMSPQCNLSEGFSAGAAIVAAPSKDGVVRALARLAEMSSDELCCMGRAGHALVKERFSWAKVSEQMYSIYQWVLGGGSPPDCIFYA